MLHGEPPAKYLRETTTRDAMEIGPFTLAWVKSPCGILNGDIFSAICGLPGNVVEEY